MPERVIEHPHDALRLDASLQRAMAGRLVMSALAEQDRADSAEFELVRLQYLSDLEHRLLASLDKSRTRDTVSHVALPELDAWAVVDVLEADGSVTRLAIVHPDFAHSDAVRALNAHWLPTDDDPIGYAAARATGRTFAILDNVDLVLANASRSSDILGLLRELEVGACLVVPLRSAGEVNGAITFMSAHARTRYTVEEIQLGEQIAAACGRALQNSRQFHLATAAQLKAEETNHAQSRMLGEVTHELRTPLTAIGGYTQLLHMGIRGPVTPEQEQDLERIRWNQQHLLSMVTQILSYVRVEAGRAEFALASIDLGAAVCEVTEMLEPLLVPKRQTFRLDGCEAGVMLAQADLDKVRQIVINLITNAMKYSAPESQIIVRCGQTEHGMFAEVEDHGIGIAEADLETIFEPFVQIVTGETGRAGGVGLGLAISRQLAAGMHGTLTVVSKVGKGSVFRLNVPAGNYVAEDASVGTPVVMPR